MTVLGLRVTTVRRGMRRLFGGSPNRAWYGVTAVVVAAVVVPWSMIIWTQLSGDQVRVGRPGQTTAGTVLALVLVAGLTGIGLLVLRASRTRRGARDRRAVPEVPCAEDSHPVREEAPGSQDPDPVEIDESVPEAATPPPESDSASADHPGDVRTVAVVQAAGEARSGTPQPDSAAPSTKVILFDRRLSRRVEYVSGARLQWPGHDLACTTGDISMRGARCNLPPGVGPELAPPAGSAVHVTLELEGVPAVLAARVGWCRVEEGRAAVGLQFMSVQQAHESLLQRIVMSGTPV